MERAMVQYMLYLLAIT